MQVFKLTNMSVFPMKSPLILTEQREVVFLSTFPKSTAQASNLVVGGFLFPWRRVHFCHHDKLTPETDIDPEIPADVLQFKRDLWMI